MMNQNSKRLLHTLILWSPLWIGSTVLFGLLGAVYGLFLKQDQWLASQALLVRDEANGATFRPGRFDSETQMKAAQETILEVARHHQVVTEALKVLGPQPSWFSGLGTSEWPSRSVVEATANSKISMRAPKGAEFGATEVIYLDVKQPSPELALKFSRALSDALEARLQSVRKTRAESIVAELSHARDAAREQLKSVTEQLQQLEKVAGIELSDLRGMTDMIAGGGNSRVHLDQLKSEIRGAETKHQELLDDLKLLQDAIADPSSFVIAPSNLVTTQPGLKRLREGYAEAQLSASQLSGKFTEVHPLLVAARTTQDSIRGRLVNELEASLGSLDQEIKTSQQKLDRLHALQTETESKLGSLAENRAAYANVIAEVKTRTTILENVERELAEAEASAEASSSTSLISRMDQPIVSDKPLGPGKTTIVGGSMLAGLMFGIGIVFLLIPNESGKSFGRRINDTGRHRSEDQLSRKEAAKIHPPLEMSQSDGQYVYHSDVNMMDTVRMMDTTPENDAVSSQASSGVPVETQRLLPSGEFTGEVDEENASDLSFREFLLSEIEKPNERRQHPRPAQIKPVAVTLSMRGPTPSSAIK